MTVISPILIVINSTHIGGAERQALNLGKALLQKGENVSFLALSAQPGALAEELAMAGIPLINFNLDTYCLDYFKKYPRGFSEWRLFLRAKKQLKVISKKIRELSPAAIIPFTYYPNLVTGLIAKKIGLRKVIWNQRDLGTEGMSKSIFEKQALKNATHFIGNSEAVIQYLKGQARSQAAYYLIENGVELKAAEKNRNEWRAALGISDREVLFLMISNIHENKDHATIIRAFELLREKPVPFKIVFTGRKYEHTYNRLVQLARECALSDNVIFLDFSNDITGLLSASDVFIFSSLKEGSPNALLEAMMAGKRIIASDITPITEALGEDYPFLFRAGDHKALADCINRLIESKSFGMRIPYSRTLNYTPENMTTKYSQLLHGA
jgi:glycosyltransferase involved in cell wall biosynthesis